MAAVIVLRKNATVKVLDIVVPIMAVCYFAITIFIIIKNISMMHRFSRIFEEAFGIRQVAAGGFGAVLMNGVKRGLFSNEAGSGSAPCAAAAAECDTPSKGRTDAGARCIYRYDSDLQLYGNDHAHCTGEYSGRERGHGFITVSYEVSSWRFWSYFYSSHIVFIQLFHLPWYTFLCKE